MRVSFITVLIFLLPFFGFSQGEFDKWCMGLHIEVDFSSGNPTLLSPIAGSVQFEGCSLSDSMGNLLFYWTDWDLRNRNQQIMPNGDSIHAQYVAMQPMFAVPHIPFDSTYFLFTIGDTNHGPINYYGLKYTMLDMRLDGGLGDVPPGEKNIEIPAGEYVYDFLTGTRHRNNRDAWIVVKSNHPVPHYLSYFIDASGIHSAPIESNTLIPKTWDDNQQSGLRISRDGSHLVFANGEMAEYCKFNSATGQITPLFRFVCTQGATPPYIPQYFEFSENGKFLYVTTGIKLPLTTSKDRKSTRLNSSH